MDLATAYATKRVELINCDGTIRDTFTLKPAEEWPEAIVWGVFNEGGYSCAIEKDNIVKFRPSARRCHRCKS